jgi:SagB-type dehydrogenase family enzyme
MRYTPIDKAQPLLASRFAVLRRKGTHMLLESPLSHARIWLLHPLMGGLWAGLTTPVTAKALASKLNIRAQDACRCLEMLECGGMLTRGADSGPSLEDDDPVLMRWSFHEALFHARSRAGRHDDAMGATYRFRGKYPPPPGRRPPYPGQPLALPKPDLESALQADISLTQALENRCSIRDFRSDEPLDLETLGHFLYRTARVTQLAPAEKDSYDLVFHLYPTGGGMGDLEVYLIAANCMGLERALYHYDAFDHTLSKPPVTRPDLIESMIDDACHSAGLNRETREPREPQVCFVFTSRQTRSMWKYSHISYATALKNVGALMQTFYLVAHAMGLAACALGSGNADDLAHLVGLDYFTEPAVGEFFLGRGLR